MRRSSSIAAAALFCLVPLTAQAQPQPQQKGEPGPCQQIRAACEQAGFERGAAKGGSGLLVDCVRPIMQGGEQRPNASKPLPQVDPQLVEACKQRNPNFGQPKQKQ
jgi:hypothetical protein